MTKMSYEDVQLFMKESDQIRAQLNYLIQQLDIITHSMNDLEGSIKTVEEIKKRKDGETILLPLGSHLLIEASIKSNDSVLFDLGSKVVQEIEFDSSILKMQNRLEELNKSKTLLSSNIAQLKSEILSRENFLNQLVPISGNQ